jgi:hypothetical protein
MIDVLVGDWIVCPMRCPYQSLAAKVRVDFPVPVYADAKLIKISFAILPKCKV